MIGARMASSTCKIEPVGSFLLPRDDLFLTQKG